MATSYEIDAEIYSGVDSKIGEDIDEEKLNTLLIERNAKIEERRYG